MPVTEKLVQFYMPPEKNRELWKVHKENMIFFAGERALRMEVLDPRIAASLVKNNTYPHSGRFERNPLGRLYETADYGLRLIFGTQEEAEAIAAKINDMHKNVHGTMKDGAGIYPEGTRYNAFDPDQMKWIAATLLDSSLVGYETFVGPLSQGEKDRYVQQASQLFKILHFDARHMPDSYDGLQEYIQGRIDNKELVLGKDGKKILPYVSLRHGPVWRGLTKLLDMTTIYTLPPELNQELGYSLSEKEEKIVKGFAKGTQLAVKYIPPEIRHPLIYVRNRRRIKKYNKQAKSA